MTRREVNFANKPGCGTGYVAAKPGFGIDIDKLTSFRVQAIGSQAVEDDEPYE